MPSDPSRCPDPRDTATHAPRRTGGQESASQDDLVREIAELLRELRFVRATQTQFRDERDAALAQLAEARRLLAAHGITPHDSAARAA